MTWLELPLLFIVNISHHVIFCFRERNMMKLSKAGQISKSRKKQYVSKVSAKCPESSTFTDKSAHLVTLVTTVYLKFGFEYHVPVNLTCFWVYRVENNFLFRIVYFSMDLDEI